ncbi:hypothetical protein KCP76_01495 [Salmonella enterica subsp. enterica serovar Weltevreden]|nr:hypothetical protein KCP76_01495 [Salmonella enterica subsp. enterica serovar Weltevreden]
MVPYKYDDENGDPLKIIWPCRYYRPRILPMRGHSRCVNGVPMWKYVLNTDVK